MTVGEKTASWKGAVIQMVAKDGSRRQERPAAFVFDVPGGFGWIEPSYADPEGAPAGSLHEVEAASIEYRNGEFAFDGPKWAGEIEWYVGQLGPSGPLDWFEGWLAEQGRTWAEERARLVAVGLIPSD